MYLSLSLNIEAFTLKKFQYRTLLKEEGSNKVQLHISLVFLVLPTELDQNADPPSIQENKLRNEQDIVDTVQAI